VEESDTYQYILEEGRMWMNRRLILRHGGRRFGEPTDAIRATLEGITDLERLRRMADRVFEATSWQAVLDTP
jgi:hypothetical protein